MKVARKDIIMIAVLIVGGFSGLMNQTVMTPALPSIMRDFGITASEGQWLTSIFLLVTGLMVPITAYLINRFTTRQLFFTAMIIFVAGTFVCAFSLSFLMLLGGRVLQAIGAGILMPFISVVIMLVFPKERRGMALGVVGVIFGVAPAAGPTFGGWLVDVYGWHYIFIIIIPISLLSIVLAIILLKNIGTKSVSKLDWLSVALSTLGFGGMLFGFSSAGSSGWGAPHVWGSIAAGLVVTTLFIYRQVKLDEPLLNFRVFKNRSFTYGMSVTTIIAMGMMVGAVITPIYLQNVLGLTALQSGLIFVPGALIMAGTSPVSGILFDRFGPRVLCIVGCSIVVASSCIFIFVGTDTSLFLVGFAYSIRLLGLSLVNMPANTWALNSLKDESIAHGNAIINTARQVFGSIGTALLVTVMMLVSGIFRHSDELVAVARGFNAAFCATALISLVALILTILRVGREG